MHSGSTVYMHFRSLFLAALYSFSTHSSRHLNSSGRSGCKCTYTGCRNSTPQKLEITHTRASFQNFHWPEVLGYNGLMTRYLRYKGSLFDLRRAQNPRDAVVTPVTSRRRTNSTVDVMDFLPPNAVPIIQYFPNILYTLSPAISFRGLGCEYTSGGEMDSSPGTCIEQGWYD